MATNEDDFERATEVLTRDYGTQGTLKYPGLREWFKAKDAERAVADAVAKQTQKLNPND